MPSDATVTAPAAFDLTFFTGRKKNAERVFFIRNYELNLFTTYVVALSAVVSVPVTALACLIIAIFAPGLAFLGAAATVAFVIAGLVFVDQRSKRGLQLRNYRAMLDRRSSADEKETLYIAGEPIAAPEISLFTPQYVLATAGNPVSTPAAGISVAAVADHGKASILDA